MEESKDTMEELREVLKIAPEYLKKSHDLALGYVDGTVCLALQNVLKDLCPRIAERHTVESKADKYVIHYTSINALMSMLQNACKNDGDSSLRLYDSVHLNDPNEGNYLAHLLSLPNKYDWLDVKNVQHVNVPHAYITSFIVSDSEEGSKNARDNLVFWRAYGQEGEGCSLSLPVSRLELQKVLYGQEKADKGHAIQPRLRLQKVFYGQKDADGKATVENLISVVDLLDPLLEIEDLLLRKNVREKLAETVWKSLEPIRYLYKSEAYKYENEGRFVITESDIPDKDKICFEYQDRSNGTPCIRHYYEHEDLRINKLLVSSSVITLGPCVPYHEDVRFCLETLKKRAELDGPEIKISEILYRKS